jgi:DNA invertase Pin-like site-specific DNA recombinase
MGAAAEVEVLDPIKREQRSPFMLRPRCRTLRALSCSDPKKAGFKSLGDTWADTTTSHGRLMLTVLAGLAEFERDLIRARTGEGRARAVERGQKMGRPFKLTDHQKREAIKRRDQGETLAEIGRSYNVSPATNSRLAA